MLDVMARGEMPSEDRPRTIAGATIEEQAQVWKKHKPKKNEGTNWWSIANALSKRRIPFSAAKFDDDLAVKHGVTWHDDLFAPAGEDSRYTTEVDGFFGAQQEWLENNLPKGGVLVPQDDYGQPSLPKKAERVYGKPGKGDIVGHVLDPRTAEVKTVAYRLPADKKAAKAKTGDAARVELPEKAQRPDVTQKGRAIIGDLRTDALHESPRQDPASDITLISFLVLALGGRNVAVQSGLNEGRFNREAICEGLIQGGVLSQDDDAVRAAARAMLVQTLSCRDNMSNSGIGARMPATRSAPHCDCPAWRPTSSSPASRARRLNAKPPRTPFGSKRGSRTCLTMDSPARTSAFISSAWNPRASSIRRHARAWPGSIPGPKASPRARTLGKRAFRKQIAMSPPPCGGGTSTRSPR